MGNISHFTLQERFRATYESAMDVIISLKEKESQLEYLVHIYAVFAAGTH